MIAVDPKNQIAYARSGQTEVWIWWRPISKEFVVTRRVGGPSGKVTPEWLGRILGADSTAKKAEPIGSVGPIAVLGDGDHVLRSSPPGVYVAHRKGSVQFEGRLVDDPEIAFPYSFVDLSSKTVRRGLVGWAY